MTDNPEEEKKVSFVFYESWWDGAQVLNGKHRLLFLESIIKYGLYCEETKLKGVENALFSAIKPTIKFNKKQRENGLKGGGTQGNSNARKTTQKRPKNDPNSPNILNDKDEYEERDVYEEPSKEGEGETPAPSREEFLETFGVLKNVKMKAAEYRHLVEDYGEDLTKDTVDDLSCKLADGNAESQNHYATILSWLRYQRRNDTGSVPMSSQTDKAAERAKELKRMWEHCSEQDRQEHLEANNNVFPWDDPKFNEYLKP